MCPETNEAVEHADPVTTNKKMEDVVEAVTTANDANAATATSVPDAPVTFDETVESNAQNTDEEEKPVKFGKISDPHVLGCCEFCGGPVKRRRFCSPLKRFCSKGCSRSSRKAKVNANSCLQATLFSLKKVLRHAPV